VKSFRQWVIGGGVDGNNVVYRSKTFWVGVVSTALGGLLHFWLVPSFITVPENMARAVLSPAFWPEILSALVIITGLVILFQGSSLSVPNPSAEDGGPSTASEDVSTSWTRLLAFCFAMVIYVGSINYLGMPISSVIMLIVSFKLLGEKRYGTSLVISAGLPILLFMFFFHVAGVSIPQGEWISLP
jgi:putative tricarboxylic transport membrane protein